MPDITFDNALEQVVSAVEQAGLNLQGCEATLLRDLRGRIRLHISRSNDQAWQPGAKEILRQALATAAPYATNVVYLEVPGRPNQEFPFSEELQRGRKLLRSAQGDSSPTWYRFDRRFSKDSWIEETGGPLEPWPLEQGAPVVSFYGFKGGVGRTTALAAFALYVADSSKNVVVVDLDLESPGLASLLAGVEPDLGVVDFLLEEQVERESPLALSRFYLASPYVASGGNVRVLTAGRLDANYIEKLGRVDVQGLVQPDKSVRNLLRRLIERVRDELHPEVILLDVRAGLHDLGGISLSGLSHLELIFAVHNDQTWAGLPLVLQHLGRLRADWVKIIHSMVPPSSRGGDEIHADFVARAYDLCSENYYLAGEIPGPEDESAAHWAYRLAFRDALLGLSDLNRSRSDLLADEHRVFCERLAQDLGLEG